MDNKNICNCPNFACWGDWLGISEQIIKINKPGETKGIWKISIAILGTVEITEAACRNK